MLNVSVKPSVIRNLEELLYNSSKFIQANLPYSAAESLIYFGLCLVLYHPYLPSAHPKAVTTYTLCLLLHPPEGLQAQDSGTSPAYLLQTLGLPHVQR